MGEEEGEEEKKKGKQVRRAATSSQGPQTRTFEISTKYWHASSSTEASATSTARLRWLVLNAREVRPSTSWPCIFRDGGVVDGNEDRGKQADLAA